MSQLQDNKSFWQKYIESRINKNKNFIGVIYGPTGSGKSWSGLSIGETLDPDFSINNIIFSGKECIDLVNGNILPNKKGNVILWEEAGIELSSRNWQSAANKLINYLLETFRDRNFILLFTVPYADFVDNQTRKLFHAGFETVSIDYKVQLTTLKPKLYQYNSNRAKFYYKYLRIRTEKGVATLKTWKIPKPSDNIIELYQKKKRQFTDNLYNEIGKQFDRLSGQGPLKPLTQRQKDVYELWKTGLKQQQIADKLGIRQNNVSSSIKELRKKGYVT